MKRVCYALGVFAFHRLRIEVIAHSRVTFPLCALRSARICALRLESEIESRWLCRRLRSRLMRCRRLWLEAEIKRALCLRRSGLLRHSFTVVVYGTENFA